MRHHQPNRVAIYARYSSEHQNPMSVRDQIASCRRKAAAQGWEVVAEYSDEAISGSRSDRPDFLRLRADLSRGLFDIVLFEDLDRLSRSMKDTAEFYAIANFYNIRLHATEGGEIDKVQIAITSLMAEMFIDNLRVKTHRGVLAKVHAGQTGGGRSYGYDVPRDGLEQTITGKLLIVPHEADVVRRIFRDYADGMSPMKIAAALNAEGVPAPRARAGSGHWKQNTINGNRNRGTGILNNVLYIGQRIWNRLEYRKDPMTSKRVSRLRPPDDWVRHDAPDLRIVDQALWEAVKARQESQAIVRAASDRVRDRNGLAISQGMKRRRYLLSGLLYCGQCGGAMTIAGSGRTKRYYCADAKQKGDSVCAGQPGVAKDEVERLVLGGLKSGLMTDAAVAQFRKDYTRHLKEQSQASSARVAARTARLKVLETARVNYKQAIASGGLNPTIQEGLTETEAEIAALTQAAEADAGNVVQIPKDIGTLYRTYVAKLTETLSGGDVVGRASEALHGLIDRITVHWDADAGTHRLDLEGDLVAMLGRADKQNAPAYQRGAVSLQLVAGAGFEPATFRL